MTETIERRVADVLAERLYEAGCRYAFGMPGGEVLTLLDAFKKAGIEFAHRRVTVDLPPGMEPGSDQAEAIRKAAAGAILEEENAPA